MLDGNGVKAMSGSIHAANTGSLKKNKKNTGSQRGTPKYIFKMNIRIVSNYTLLSYKIDMVPTKIRRLKFN